VRAFVITGPRTASVVAVARPVAGRGEVVVDVERAGVCGTDGEFFSGEMAYLRSGEAAYPIRIGHEWCGVVSSVGDGVDPAWLGRRVTGDTMLGCGSCVRCRGGRQHLCADRYEVGIRGGWPGALAEQLAMPARALHPLPDAVDPAAGALVEPERLLHWAAQLAERGGWLVVDEAFGDTLTHYSVAAHTSQAGLIVLRSVGKFFGLAGLRLGFVAAAPELLAELADWLGPWTISGPAQQIGCAALRDRDWQAQTRQRLQVQGQRLQQLLGRHGIAAQGTALFQWWPEPQAQAFHACMAEAGVWVRLFTRGAGGIRIGLPPDEAGWQRLHEALTTWSQRG